MEKIVIFDMDGVLVDTEPVYYKRLEDFLISRGYAFPPRGARPACRRKQPQNIFDSKTGGSSIL